jgi:tRNA nucleotidyltransferase (CCA-adding enzyme)
MMVVDFMVFDLPKEVKYILNKFIENNFEAYIVGGCVRDILLNFIPKDWDITTNAKPEKIMSLFQNTIPTGIKHGTVTVIIDDRPFEITTFRIDGKYSDNRHPDTVEFTTSLEDDLSRRDFTINAMAYNNESNLIDLFQGKVDLYNKLIRAVGSADKRFYEDSLRMLRAVRFSSQLSFKIENKTFKSIQNNANLITHISMDRIRDEFSKLLLSANPAAGIRTLKDTGLLKYILPELCESIGFDQQNPHHDKDVFEHILSVVENSKVDLTLRLSALLHDIGKPRCFSLDNKGVGHFYDHNLLSAEMSEEILKRLKFDNNTIKLVCTFIREHMSVYANYKSANLKKFINRVGIENLDNFFELLEADSKGHKAPYDFSRLNTLKDRVKEVLMRSDPLSVKDLNLTGDDLLHLGFQEGKEIGLILNKLLDLVLSNPELNTKEKLIQLVKNKIV